MTLSDTNDAMTEISGKKLLGAIGAAIGVSALTGGLSYGALRFLDSSSRSQAIVVTVYATLATTLCVFFRPPAQPPIGLRGFRTAVNANIAWPTLLAKRFSELGGRESLFSTRISQGTRFCAISYSLRTWP